MIKKIIIKSIMFNRRNINMYSCFFFPFIRMYVYVHMDVNILLKCKMAKYGITFRDNNLAYILVFNDLVNSNV